MSEKTTRKQTLRARGWLIIGASLALLFGIVALKANADSGGDDLNQ
ncbi:MAG: hypothetical protein H7Z38_23955 [Rubrivivax sp.]|nr:hypothetical protein [Pyrinomonadaceae bacterium]